MADANNNNSSHVDTLELDPADGQQYIEELRDRLLDLVQPYQTIDDVEDRLRKLYPESKLVNLAIREAHKSRLDAHKSHKVRHHSSSSASFTGALHNITSFAVAKVSNLVRDGVVSNKSESEVFKIKVIEFIINDVLELAGDFVRRQKNNFIITRSDIRTAMHADKDLLDLFLSDDKSLLSMENHPLLAQVTGADKYGHHSCHHQLSTTTYKQKVRNMVDSENSYIRGLKLVIKVFKAQLEVLPHIKREVDIIFCNVDELLELSTQLLTLLEDALDSVGQEEGEIPYVGSEILDLAQAEEFHAYFTFAYRRLSHNERWQQAFMSITSNDSTMTSIKTAGQPFDLAVKHLLPNYLLNAIGQFFQHFKNFGELYELSKRHDNPDDELALKETLSILIKTKRAIEALLETDLDTRPIETLDPKQAESIRITLERQLDNELKQERNLPLPFMPPPEIYRFSEPDSKDNIQFEEVHNNHNAKDLLQQQLRNDTEQIPVIRCATLIKLVERLTYHKYQPNIVDSFLTTYRAFISDPEELLDLLIERFKIPDPPLSVVYPDFIGGPDDLPEVDRTNYKHYLKRFRQEYSKPVKMRVINVLKSWIKNHFYDFERHPTLLEKLQSFLDEVCNSDKVLRSLIASIRKSIEQKKLSQRDDFEFMLSKEPPPIVWWFAKEHEPEKFDILTLHPVEFARQLTLFEFDLFRAIKPSELINVRDLGFKRKEDKYESSPNLSRMTRHFTLLSYWIRKSILEVEDFEKRAAIYNRAIEIMGVLRDLNNFTGLLSIGSAILSAPIVRLSHTRKTLTNTTTKIIEEYRELTEDHQKKLQRELRKCDPPCIPYLGSYQTKLIHAKEGNKTFIDEVDTSSPTLSNEEFHSPFSISPATPISPRTPLHRTPAIIPANPPSATSTIQNQFFGGCATMSRLPAGAESKNTGANTNNGFPGANSIGYNTIGAHFSYLSNPTYTFNIGNGASGGNMAALSFGALNSPASFGQLQQQAPSPMTPHTPLTPATPKMINFTKQRIRAGLVAEISNYQNPPYCLKVQPEIRQYIESIEPQLIKFGSSLLKQTSATSTKEEVNVPAMTKRLDDFLFEQSERIEPKNCTKPIRSKSKLPDYWKSPGIKVNNCATPK